MRLSPGRRSGPPLSRGTMRGLLLAYLISIALWALIALLVWWIAA